MMMLYYYLSCLFCLTWLIKAPIMIQELIELHTDNQDMME